MTAERRKTVRPLLIWLVPVVGFTASCFVALPFLGADFDFVRDGHVAAHIVDRSQMPLLVVQNGPRNVAYCAIYAVWYWLAYAAYEVLLKRGSLRFAVPAFVTGALALVALPVVPTTDMYAYALYALEGGPLALDPYVAHAGTLGGGLWSHVLLTMFPTVTASVRICNYGPFFVLVYGLIAQLCSASSLLSFLVAERVLGALGIVIAALGFAAAGVGNSREHRVRSACAFAFHPLVLFEFVAFAHGDILMIAALAWALVCIRNGRFTLAGALCGIATASRFVAVLAVAALLAAAARRSPAAFARAGAGAFGAVALLCAYSWIRFGTVSFGGAPVFSDFSAPFLALASLAGIARAQSIGFSLEAAFGVAVVFELLRRYARGSSPQTSLAWLPLGALAGAPSLYAHYAAWFVSLRGVTDEPRITDVTRIVSLVVPLLYVVHVDPFAFPGAPVSVQLAVLATVWFPVLLVLVRTPRVSARA